MRAWGRIEGGLFHVGNYSDDREPARLLSSEKANPMSQRLFMKAQLPGSRLVKNSNRFALEIVAL